MSYTGSHLHNFIPGAAPSPQPVTYMPLAQPNRREVRPLFDSNCSPEAPPFASASSSSVAQAQAAHLEAHVRMLEQEVHLLRTGLVQNERLRQSTAAPPSAAPSPPKRIHFGPSSIVPIPHVARRGGAAGLRTARKPSTSPQRKLPPATRPGQAGEAHDTRPKLVFGQRVDPTQSRSTVISNNNNGNVASTADATAPTSSPSTAREGGAAISQSYANPNAAMATPSATTTTTYVPLTHAAASLRGSNTAGVPLQGAATGATVVSALDGAPPSPSPATVWAAADPALLWKRAAVAASASEKAGGAVAATDADNRGRRGDVMASYPFRTAAPPAAAQSPPVVVKAVSTTPAVVSAASPIVVTMSSDGWPPRAAQTNPTEKVSTPPPTVEITGPTAAVGGVPSSWAPAETATTSQAPQPTNEILVEELKQHIAALRDTLGQREALLHRVLAELHDRGSPSRNASGQHRGEPEDPSRRTLRLLTQELLSAQTQLSHARASYRILHEEMRRRLQLQQQQQQQVPSPSSPPPPPPEAGPAPPAPTPAVVSAPAEAELRSQLTTALQKVKAWEDWYTTTEAGATQRDVSSAPEAAVAAPTSKDKSHDKRKKASSQAQIDAEERDTQRRSRACDDGCGGCGAMGSGASTRHSGASPASLWYNGATNAPRLHCISSSPLPLSAYAMDDTLYNEFVRSRCAPATVYRCAQMGTPGSHEHVSFVAPSTPTTAAAAASATPPQEPAASFRLPRTDASAAPTSQRDDHLTAAVGSGVVSTVAPVSSAAYYCDDLEHAWLQACYGQRYVTQMAREAAVRELAEMERRVAEERLAVVQRHPMTAATTVPDASTPKKESAAGEAVDEM